MLGRVHHHYLFSIPIQAIKSRPRNKGPSVATVKAMADTGCSQMITGTDFIKNIGIKGDQLIPVDTVVKGNMHHF